MARPLTAPELVHYRSEYQRCQLFLAAPTSETVFTARLNGTPSSTDKVYEITYDGGSAGFADALAGQTLYIGTEAGAYDKGVLRLRGTLAGVSGTMKIGETSEIDWADNDYLTIVDDLALWPRHLWIDGSGVIFVDHDVAYTDQHEDCDPVPVLGPDAVKWLTGATVDVEFDASDSWVIGSTIASYSWAAPGASASSGMATATPTITYDTANVDGYRVACTVTATNGKSFTGYRRAFVFDTNNQPVTTFKLDDSSGDWSSGGWRFKVTLWGEATRAEIRDRARIILFARDWYGSTEISIGPVDDRENVVCAGRIAGESIEWDPEQGSVSFEVVGPQHWVSKMIGFPAGLEDFAGTPTVWVEFEDLTVDRGLWHFLHWRTTATLGMDVLLTGDSLQIKVFDAPLGMLWQQITQESERTILARPACDRYERLFVQIDSNLLPVVDRGSIPVVQTLLKQDWHGGIGAERVVLDAAAQVNLSGVAYAGGSATALFGLSPGHVPKTFGNIQREERLALDDQAGSNELTGLIAGKANNEYPALDIELAANHRMVDICPHQYLQLSVAAGDTERGIVLTDYHIIPRRVSFQHDPTTGMLLTTVTCEGYTLPELAVTGDPPPAPPPRPDPPLPPLPPAPPAPPLWEGVVRMAIAHTQSEFGFTADLFLRHVDSLATTGTTGTTVYDTAIGNRPGEDFISIGIAVGDIVENVVTHAWTTVAAIVSGTQLTLAADIGLGDGSAYAIAATNWVDATNAVFDPATTGEEIIQFAYVRTGADTVGGWVLTDAGVYHAANVLTPSPNWVEKLTLADARTACSSSSAEFRGLAVSALDPAFAIVTLTSTTYITGNIVPGGVYTEDTGGSWSVSYYSPKSANPPRHCPYRGITVDNGTVYAIRGYQRSGTPPTACGTWSGTPASLTPAGDYISDDRLTDRAFVVARGGALAVVVTNDNPLANPLTSGDGGATFSSVLPSGYTMPLESGIVGHYDTPGDIVCILDRTADGEIVLARSSDTGTSFTDITDDLKAMFDQSATEARWPVIPDGWPWPPDSDVLGLINATVYSAAAAKRKIYITDNNGRTWFNKTTNFATSLGWDWGDWGGKCGFIGLPRVGANA